ncbi:globin domain-containing protein [Salipiger mangrovisoli]|uniref:Hemin receptor n=1 Tax=Salipiger mangrovisoli TaxID=2865933 RepID=A0ABR9X1P2_9RHOB|nr:globin domain-containing protein [Salipiger mangrovisoli]MBE9637483.1 hemin receptor [Salipiger mangrovisoli]
MTLTTQNISDIRASWQVLAADADAFTSDFYAALFRRNPALRSLFANTDLPAQRKKLVAALALVVRQADDLAPLLAPLADMGARHLGYGVKEADYDAVGGALIETMETHLRALFTAEVRAAWLAAYGAVAGAMMAGARAAAARKSA